MEREREEGAGGSREGGLGSRESPEIQGKPVRSRKEREVGRAGGNGEEGMERERARHAAAHASANAPSPKSLRHRSSIRSMATTATSAEKTELLTHDKVCFIISKFSSLRTSALWLEQFIQILCACTKQCCRRKEVFSMSVATSNTSFAARCCALAESAPCSRGCIFHPGFGGLNCPSLIGTAS